MICSTRIQNYISFRAGCRYVCFSSTIRFGISFLFKLLRIRILKVAVCAMIFLVTKVTIIDFRVVCSRTQIVNRIIFPLDVSSTSMWIVLNVFVAYILQFERGNRNVSLSFNDQFVIIDVFLSWLEKLKLSQAYIHFQTFRNNVAHLSVSKADSHSDKLINSIYFSI